MASADGKWFPGLTGDTCVGFAARQIIGARAEVVRQFATRLCADPRSDIQDVHQLRVGARRLAAALAAFAPLFDPTTLRRARRAARRIRRVAGAVRDFDVLVPEVGTAVAEAPWLGDDVGQCVCRTVSRWLQRAVRQMSDELPDDVRRFERAMAAIESALNSGGASSEQRFDERADQVIRQYGEGVIDAASKDLTDIDHLHGLRITVKQLRYGLELFGSCLSPGGVDRLYAEVEGLQRDLGAVNDLRGLHGILLDVREAVANHFKTDEWGATRGGLDRLLAGVAHQWFERQRAFVAQWHGYRRRNLEDAWRESLRRLVQHAARGAAVESSDRQNRVVGRSGQMNVGAPDRPTLVRGPGVAGRPAGKGEMEASMALRQGHRARLAAIDVGTNSIRLVVAELERDGNYRVLDEEREMTRLGAGLNATGRLSAESMERSIEALSKMKAIADGFQVRALRAMGTSAVREASNGDEFRREVQRRVGLNVDVADADTEARLVFQSAVRHFKLDGTLTAVVDIGGGSLELVLAAETVVERLYSLPLGAVRVTEAFGLSDRLEDEQWDRLKREVDRAFKQAIGKLPFQPDTMIGSGGTFSTIAEMIRYRREGKSDTVHGYLMTVAEVRQLLRQLGRMTLAERRQVPGLTPARADIIIAGLAVVVRMAKYVGVHQILVNDRGVRDGLLLSMISELVEQPTGTRSSPTDRMEWVRQFARKCRSDEAHCEHVALLSRRIFDELQGRFELPPESRDLLVAAALLHDVGYLINHDRHHKHAYHLVMNGELLGFSSRETEVIANVARYHRRAIPKKSHENFAWLSPGDRQLVRRLAGILRIADGLDRTHTSRIRRVRCAAEGDGVLFQLEADSDPHVEVWYAEGKSDLFVRAFGLTPQFEWRRGGEAAAVGVPSRESSVGA